MKSPAAWGWAFSGAIICPIPRELSWIRVNANIGTHHFIATWRRTKCFKKILATKPLLDHHCLQAFSDIVYALNQYLKYVSIPFSLPPTTRLSSLRMGAMASMLGYLWWRNSNTNSPCSCWGWSIRCRLPITVSDPDLLRTQLWYVF